MTIYQIIALCAAVLCLILMLFHLFRLIRLGAPKDLSEKSGNVGKSVVYSNTMAMMPNAKESAYLHIPTFTLGVLFHVGTFLSLLVFLLSFFPFFTFWLIHDPWIHYAVAAIISITALSGLLLFGKRMYSRSLRHLSNADDFLSNGFTTVFQIVTFLYLSFPAQTAVHAVYYIFSALLFLYMPVGKLKHAVYYFAARFHLGHFYGWRNVWPPKTKNG